MLVSMERSAFTIYHHRELMTRGVEVLEKRLLSNFQKVCGTGHISKDDAHVKSLVDRADLWEMLEQCQTRFNTAEAASRDLEAVEQEEQAIEERAEIWSDRALSGRLALGIDGYALDPTDLDLDLGRAKELTQQKHNLQTVLRKSRVGVKDAEALAFLCDQAFVDDALLRARGNDGESRDYPRANQNRSYERAVDISQVQVAQQDDGGPEQNGGSVDFQLGQANGKPGHHVANVEAQIAQLVPISTRGPSHNSYAKITELLRRSSIWRSSSLSPKVIAS